MHPFLQYYFRSVKRLMPSQAGRTALGIDFSASVCRFVEIALKGDGVELLCAGEILVENGDEKAALVKAVAEANQTKIRSVVASVSGKGTLIRYIELPRMSLRDLKKAFLIEADKYFPFPKETIYTDCHILDERGSEKKMAVLAAGVKKDVVDPRVKLCKDAGIELDGVGLATVGVANVFEAFPPKIFSKEQKDSALKGVAVIDIGEAGTNLMVLARGLPKFSRDIYIGTGEIIKRIANTTGVPYAQARASLFARETKPDAVVRMTDAVLGDLATELALSFDYFVTEKNITIHGIALVGEGAMLKGAESFFAGKFDIPIIMWDPLAEIPLASGVAPLADTGRKYVTALGMALQVYDKD